MKNPLALLVCALVLFVAVAPAFVLAQDFEPGEPAPRTLPDNVKSGKDFLGLVALGTNWLFVFLIAISVIFIVLAGLQFIMAGGEPTAVSQARTKLIYATVGIIVALVARGIPAALENILGTNP